MASLFLFINLIECDIISIDYRGDKMFKNKRKFNKDKKSIFSKLSDFIFVDDDDTNDVKNKVVVSKKIFTKFEVFFIGCFLLMLGIVIGCLVTIFTNTVLGSRIDSKMMEFLKTYDYVKNNYYEDISENSLIDSAISGMLSSLGDEHSFYMDQESTSSFNESVSGSYIGIGITIKYQEGVTTIIDIFKKSPAEKVGLKVGDILIKVDDIDVTNNNSYEISNLISGDVGKVFNITVKRGEDILSFDVTLSKIELESVSSEIKDVNGKKIAYVKISNFASNTYKQFKNNLAKLEKNNIDSLIIDVRNNTGGHLSVVSDILDLFFEKNTVLYQIQDKKTTTKYKAKTSDKRDYPVVILTNHGSASASEVLASCFKEKYFDATVVGTVTYGKGTVQKAITLSDGSSYKFTTQKWLTSKGKWLNEKGVIPDVEVEISDDENIDNQLEEALKILSEK